MRLAVLRLAASGGVGGEAQQHILALLEPLLQDKDDWPRLTAEAVKDPASPFNVEAMLQGSAARKDVLRRLEVALEASPENLAGLHSAEEKFVTGAADVADQAQHSHFRLRSSLTQDDDGDFEVQGTGL